MVSARLGTEPVMFDVLMNLTDEFLGDIIDEVLEKYYSDTRLMIDYEELLEYITMEIVEKNENADDYETFHKLVKKLARQRSLARVFVSYLISKYLEQYIPEEIR